MTDSSDSTMNVQAKEIVSLLFARQQEKARDLIPYLSPDTTSIDRLIVAAHLAVEQKAWNNAENLWKSVAGFAENKSIAQYAETMVESVRFIRQTSAQYVMQCNICEGRDFIRRKHRIFAWCGACKSLERTRVLKLHLDQIGLDDNTKILHIAPESSIMKYLITKIKKENYLCADIDENRYVGAVNFKKIDLCQDEWQIREKFDVIIHSHVMEHLPCD